MTFRHTRGRARTFVACALLASLAACGGEQPGTKSNSGNNAQASSPAATTSAASVDASKLDGEIEQLEKAAQRNPGDDETLDKLAGAYVRRANSLREAQRLKEALTDYQHALRINPNNEEAQKNAAEVALQLEGTPQEGEYGEPPPLPITPNVTGGEEKATPTATPTPKKQ